MLTGGNKNSPASTPTTQAPVVVLVTKPPTTPTIAPSNTASIAPTPIGGGTGKIAFASDGEIYTMDVGGSNITRLTNSGGYYWSPAWSPDGKHIAFTSNHEDNWGIHIMNADGSNQTHLTFDVSGSPVWSPDGKQIAFSTSRNLYLMKTYHSGYDDEPVWSPDGKYIAFVSDRDGNNEIYIMNSDGSNQTRLTNNSVGDYEPVWSPDGKYIAFTSYRDGNDEIYIMKADGSEVTRLTNNSVDDDYPAWQP